MFVSTLDPEITRMNPSAAPKTPFLPAKCAAPYDETEILK
jgi:hypothetical protein